MILNPDNICPGCGHPRDRRYAMCNDCADHTPKGKVGRPRTYTDDQIIGIIDGYTYLTVDMLLGELQLRSKTTLIKRLRKMRDAGLIRMEERARSAGFVIKPKE